METVPVGAGATPGQRPRRSRFLTNRRTPASRSVMNMPVFAVLLSQLSLHLCRRSDFVMKDGARYSCNTGLSRRTYVLTQIIVRAGALRAGVGRVGDLALQLPAALNAEVENF